MAKLFRKAKNKKTDVPPVPVQTNKEQDKTEKPAEPAELSEEEKRHQRDIELLAQLVNVIRSSNKRSREKTERAFEQIVDMLKQKIKQVVFRFNIPGHTKEDIYQEALTALRYKAIQDYDPSKSKTAKVSPFDKFAVLCINRHLSTKYKSCFNNKTLAMTTATSLDRDRSNSSKHENDLFLGDIQPCREGDNVEKMLEKDYSSVMIRRLMKRLSDFEQLILKLYSCSYSYKQMVVIIEEQFPDFQLGDSLKEQTKSIDNAMSRIKSKADEVKKKYGKELYMTRKRKRKK